MVRTQNELRDPGQLIANNREAICTTSTDTEAESTIYHIWCIAPARYPGLHSWSIASYCRGTDNWSGCVYRRDMETAPGFACSFHRCGIAIVVIAITWSQYATSGSWIVALPSGHYLVAPTVAVALTSPAGSAVFSYCFHLLHSCARVLDGRECLYSRQTILRGVIDSSGFLLWNVPDKAYQRRLVISSCCST